MTRFRYGGVSDDDLKVDGMALAGVRFYFFMIRSFEGANFYLEVEIEVLLVGLPDIARELGFVVHSVETRRWGTVTYALLLPTRFLLTVRGLAFEAERIIERNFAGPTGSIKPSRGRTKFLTLRLLS